MRYGERVFGLDGLGFGVVRKLLGGRQAQDRLCSGPSLSLWYAHLIEILRLSGYFIQLLRYTAAVDGDIDT